MSKRKRGGPNKPADSTSPKPRGAEGDATQAPSPTQAKRAAADKPASAFPSVPPPTVQGKPMGIADLRVPPLPQLDTLAPAARPAKKSGTAASARSKRTSQPPKAPPPIAQEKPDAPQAKAEQPQVEEASFASPSIVSSNARPEPRFDEAPEPPRPAGRPSLANTIAPPHKRARALEAAGEVGAPPAALDTSRSEARINGTVFPPLASEATARFDENNEDEISIEGIENTARVASELPAGRSTRELADDGESHEPAARLARGSTSDRAREAAAFGSSESLLSTDYYFRQYGAHGLRSLAAEVDDFGFDPHVDEKVRPALDMLCRRYFRVELEGAELVPEQGRALLVANRSGALPWDGLVLRTALRSARPSLSPLRWLAEDSVIHYPFMGVFMNRLGAVRACPENAERLLTQDRLVAVFPEGAQGSRKLFRDRYRLQRFGRGGYVKLALKLGVPILPTAIIGAEETNPVLGRSRVLGRFFGSDSVPITPTFPWLGLAGLLPAPVRWRIVVGAPIDLSGYGPESAEDALVVHRLNEQIRSSLQTLVDQGKQQRGSALFG